MNTFQKFVIFIYYKNIQYHVCTCSLCQVFSFIDFLPTNQQIQFEFFKYPLRTEVLAYIIKNFLIFSQDRNSSTLYEKSTKIFVFIKTEISKKNPYVSSKTEISKKQFHISSFIYLLARKRKPVFICYSFIFPQYIIFLLYSASLCFSSSAGFLYHLQPYSWFLFFSSSERSGCLSEPFFEAFFCFLIISGWQIFRHFYK